MANNTTLNTGTGGDIISDDQITTLNGGTISTGEKVQRIKITYGAVGTATDVTTSNLLPVASTLNAETTKVIGTVNVAAAQTVTVTQATPANLNATVIQQAITKGTQGATGVTTQDLKDAGRVYCNFAGANPVTGVITEALITLTPYRDLVAGSTGTTFAVTSGKRLRLQCLMLTWRNNTAAAGGITIRLRLLAGTVLVGSPIHATLNASTSLATIGSGTTAFIDLPDGLELSGTMQLGLTQLAVTAVAGFDVNLIGYEY